MDWDENWNRQGDSRVKWSTQKNKVEGDETSARKDEIKENCNENKKEEQKEAEKRDAQMWKGVKTCVRKKGKKAQTYDVWTRPKTVQNRVTMWRMIDGGRDTIEKTTRIFEAGGGLKLKC